VIYLKLFRTFLSFVLLTALILPFSGQTFAAKTMTATVEVDKLNIRAKTSISATKLGSLTKGTKVTVYKKTASGWSQIKYNEKTAYVSTQYLTFKSKKRVTYQLPKRFIHTIQHLVLKSAIVQGKHTIVNGFIGIQKILMAIKRHS
jgi:uncharacterized protein YraI